MPEKKKEIVVKSVGEGDRKMKGVFENQLQFKILPGQKNFDGNASLAILYEITHEKYLVVKSWKFIIRLLNRNAKAIF